MKQHNLRRIGSLLRDSWQMYRENFSQLIRTYLYALIGFIPLLATILLFFAYSQAFPIFSFFWQVILAVILVYAALFSFGFLIYMSVNAYMGMFVAIKEDFQLQPKENVERAKKYFWSYIVISMLTLMLILFWFFLLVIPALVFTVFYSFAVYALVFEGKREMEAIDRSKELVRGRFWPVAGRLLFLILIVAVISGIFASLRSFSEEGTLWFSLMSLIEQVVAFILTPFYLLYSYFIYKDLAKKRA